MDKSVKGLGKGLSILMGEDDVDLDTPKTTETVSGEKIVFLSLDTLEPGPFQPRYLFNEEALLDLVASIKDKGVLQPLLVRPNKKNPGMYEIIAGERRYRASKIAGLKQVPAIIKSFDDKTTLEVALIENLQREDLNPLEEAEGYKRLLKEFNYTQEELSKIIGKSRSHLANMMRLLDLPDTIKHFVENKQLSIGHARALLNAKNPEALAHQVIEKGLSVRQTEKLAMNEGGKIGRKKPVIDLQGIENAYKKDSDIMALETELTQMLNTPVNIKWTGKGGEVVIVYDGLDKLDVILQRLTAGGPVVNN